MPAAKPNVSSRGNTGAWLVMVAILVLAGLAVLSGFKTRFEAGDTYPPYSSLRSDPVGSRALYEALEITPSVKVERNMRSLEFIKGKPGDVLILAGLSAAGFNLAQSRHEIDAVAQFVRDGGRLVVALKPAVHYSGAGGVLEQALDELDEEDAEEKKEKKSDRTDQSDRSDPVKKPETTADREERETYEKKREMSLAEAFRIAAKPKPWNATDDTKRGTPLSPKAPLKLAAKDLPTWRSNTHVDDNPNQDWRASAAVLSGEDDGKTDERMRKRVNEKLKIKEKEDSRFIGPPERSRWTTMAAKGDRVMIAQLALGKGSVVVCTDRFFLSNEALWADEGAELKPAFLSWLLGDAKRIVFDETSLAQGIGEQDGIMTLARRYGMHGLFLGGILLFALYIWRSAFSLVPPDPDEDLGIKRGEAVAGRGAASGLEGLLRRGVKSKELLRRCFDVWTKTRGVAQAIPTERRSAAAAALATFDKSKDPVATYHAIRDALHPPRN